ncbi:hypothetical protein NEOLEDRAFT_1169457 [Neolentinus lepideus HHB14362 ss-1]|uniref:LigT-like protein n=1 Tax=Neolentinus lepideus HHB14362 ss-1 TaxID=1314782 RepID=A0A165SRY2_9AGAM|nr:hypothetical protein NEOLEDRAFT_1169457 [Neolentinus lepideus HHB14362 ss-1]
MSRSRVGGSNALPDHKSYKSAVVLIPRGWRKLESNLGNDTVNTFQLLDWIHKVRSVHDRHIHRWPMPHITILYPFVHPQENAQVYGETMEKLRNACRSYRMTGDELTVSLGSGEDALGYFLHSSKSATVYLRPEGSSWLGDLMRHILMSDPKLRPYDEQIREGVRLPKEDSGDGDEALCGAIERHFKPHLSLGQWQGRVAAVNAIPDLAKSFPGPMEWETKELCILHRNGFKDPFQVVETIPINGPS